MASYHDDAPEASDAFAGHDDERWTADPTLWSDYDQWCREQEQAREELDCRTYPVPADDPLYVDVPVYDSDDMPF